MCEELRQELVTHFEAILIMLVRAVHLICPSLITVKTN